jgi:hypothetical protein
MFFTGRRVLLTAGAFFLMAALGACIKPLGSAPPDDDEKGDTTFILDTRLETLAVFYNDSDVDMSGFLPQAQKSTYTFTVEDGHESLRVRAKPAARGALVKVRWRQGAQFYAMEPEAEEAAIDNIPLPAVWGETLIDVEVRHGARVSVYAVIVRAYVPTLKRLTIAAAGVSSGNNLVKEFHPALMEYVVQPPVPGQSLTVDAEPSDLSAAADYETSARAPAAGEAAVVVLVTVTRKGLSSVYRVTLLPPQNDSAADKTLAALELTYGTREYAVIGGAFSPYAAHYSYQVPEGETKVRVRTVIPASTLASAAITYADGSAYPLPSAQNNFNRDVFIALPESGAACTVQIKVTAENGSHQSYFVVFTASDQTAVWQGSASMSDALAGLYTIIGVEARTRDNLTFSSPVAGDGAWSMAIPKTSANDELPPVAFNMILRHKSNGKTYRNSFSGAGARPELDVPLYTGGENVNIAGEIRDAMDMLAMNASENYYLAEDIDLSDTGGDWEGPLNFKGTFDGNGHWVRALKLVKTSGNTGLFRSLAAGAVIKNLHIEIASKEGGVGVNGGDARFGALVAVISETGTYTIRNVHVRGSLVYTPFVTNNNALIVGGLIGEIAEHAAKVPVVFIENCSAAVSITGDLGENTGSAPINVGGLAGRIAAYAAGNETLIKNCYTAGVIHLTAGQGRQLVVGGLAGSISMADGTVKPLAAQIINCYSSMELRALKTSGGEEALYVAAGGLVGYFNTSSAMAKITRSVALNPVVQAESSANVYAGRILSDRTASSHPPLASNHALDSMLLGEAPLAGGGLSNHFNGANVGTARLQSVPFWTGMGLNELGWDAAVWNFSGVSTGSYPTL